MRSTNELALYHTHHIPSLPAASESNKPSPRSYSLSHTLTLSHSGIAELAPFNIRITDDSPQREAPRSLLFHRDYTSFRALSRPSNLSGDCTPSATRTYTNLTSLTPTTTTTYTRLVGPPSPLLDSEIIALRMSPSK